MTDAQLKAYQAWVVAEAHKVNSDGCTKVSEWHQWCCFQHDLACRYAKDPMDAFRLAMMGEPDYWGKAKDMSRAEADKVFFGCNWKASNSVKEKARSVVRYIGVRIGALWPF